MGGGEQPPRACQREGCSQCQGQAAHSDPAWGWHRTLEEGGTACPSLWASGDPPPLRALGAARLACSHPPAQACGVRGHRLPRPAGPSVSSGPPLLLPSPGAFLPEAGRGLRGAWPAPPPRAPGGIWREPRQRHMSPRLCQTGPSARALVPAAQSQAALVRCGACTQLRKGHPRCPRSSPGPPIPRKPDWRDTHHLHTYLHTHYTHVHTHHLHTPIYLHTQITTHI